MYLQSNRFSKDYTKKNTRFVLKKYPIFTGVDKVPIYRKCRPRKIPKKYRVFAGFDKYLPHLSTCLQSTVTVFRKCWTRKVPASCWKRPVLRKYWQGTRFFRKLLQIKYALLVDKVPAFRKWLQGTYAFRVDEVPIIRPCLQIKVPIRWENNCFSIKS